MHEIRSFIRLAPGFSAAGQPTEEQLGLVAANGVRLVVNLAMADSDFALPDERRTVESLGMRYAHIPVPFGAPSVEHYLSFERELLASNGEAILVHCALNWRGTSFVALYAERRLGWERSASDALRHRFWTPNEIWGAWARAVRSLPLYSEAHSK